MNNSQRTTEFLAKLSDETRAYILTNIALHYDISTAEAYDEITDPEAEHLLDYVTGPARPATYALMRKAGLGLL